MESELFMELSETQQELVSGGGQLYSLSDDLWTTFHQENSVVALGVLQTSGPNGSANVQTFGQVFQDIDTSAYKYFDAYFN